MPTDLRYRPRHARRGFQPPSPPRPVRRLVAVAAALVMAVPLAAGLGLRLAGRPDRPHQPAPPRATGAATPVATGAPAPAAPVLHRLRITTHPPGARLVIRTAEGSVRSVRTPFAGRVAEGHVELALTMPGRNRLEQTIDLTKNRSVDLWLDEKGQILHKLGQFSTGPAPKQVAFSPDGSEIWVTDLGGDGIEVFDAHTMKRLADVDLGHKGAVEVIFTKDGSTVYASQMETASVYEIDRATRKVRRHLFTTGSWSKVLALSPDEKRLYVSNWVSDDVSEIDLVTGKERRRFHTVDTPRGLYVTPDGKRLYVAGFQDGEIQRFDLRTLHSKILLRTGGAIRHLVGDPARGLLYVDDMAGDAIYRVDLAAETVRMLARTDHMPNTIDLSPDGRVLYVSDRGRNNPVSYYRPGPEWGSVLAIDTATGRILDAIVGGNQTTGLDVSTDGTTLAFSDFLDNRVSLYAVPAYQTLLAGRGGRAAAHRAELAK